MVSAPVISDQKEIVTVLSYISYAGNYLNFIMCFEDV